MLPSSTAASTAISTAAASAASTTAASAASTAVKLTEETVLAILTSYANDWSAALDFYSYAASPPNSFAHTPATLSATIDILGKHLKFPAALSLLRSFLSPSPDRRAFRSLFSRLASAHRLDDALHVFHHDAPRFGLKDLQTYHLLVDALCEHRHVADAVKLCLSSKKDPPFPADTKIYNMILRGWLKVGSFGRCRDFWLEMGTKRIPKDLYTYTIYMDMLSKSGMPRQAAKLYKEMKKYNWVLDVVVYNIAIHGVGVAEGADQAVRVFREMMDDGCRPNVVSFNTIIKLFCKEGRVTEGLSFLERMEKMGCEPNAMTYHCFFHHSRNPDEMLRLFEKMVKSGCRPMMDTYVMLLRRFGGWGYLRPVFIVWKTMEELGVSPDAFAYRALIDALLQKGLMDLADKYDKEMFQKGLSTRRRKELAYLSEEAEVDDGDNAFGGVL